MVRCPWRALGEEEARGRSVAATELAIRAELSQGCTAYEEARQARRRERQERRDKAAAEGVHCWRCGAPGHTRTACPLVTMPRADAMATTPHGRAVLEQLRPGAIDGIAAALLRVPRAEWGAVLAEAGREAERRNRAATATVEYQAGPAAPMVASSPRLLH